MKRFLYLATLLLAVFALAIFPNLTTVKPVKSEPILLSQNVNFKPPNINGLGNRQGSISRCSCLPNLSMTGLTPEINAGLTLSESPTFLAYIPQTSAQIEFYLQTQDGRDVVYKTDFKMEKPGIVGVTIPTTAGDKKSLEIGKRYQWSFSVVCNPEDRSGDVYVTSYVERIAAQPTLKNDLANPDPMARLTAYAENGIWYETVATLAEMRRQAPGDVTLTAEWRKLLQSQQLDSIADQPLVQSF